MDINATAPVIARTRVEIKADRETVWRVLTDLERWPDWKSDVASLKMSGPLTPGTSFVWKAGPGTITSRLEQVDEPATIAWTGKTLGIRAVDVFRLEERDGITLVVEEESWQGAPARLFRRRMLRTLQTGIERGLQALKAEAERQAVPGPAS